MCAPVWNSSARIKRVTGRSMAVGIGTKQKAALSMSALEGEADMPNPRSDSANDPKQTLRLLI